MIAYNYPEGEVRECLARITPEEKKRGIVEDIKKFQLSDLPEDAGNLSSFFGAFVGWNVEFMTHLREVWLTREREESDEEYESRIKSLVDDVHFELYERED